MSSFFKSAAVLFCGLCCGSRYCAAEPNLRTQPNFLIIVSDDQSAADNGCCGNRVVRTANIDRLASEGLRFTHAFTGTAMCTPSRSMLLTGLYPVRNGALANHSAVRPGTKSLPHYLSALGYRAVLFPVTLLRIAAAAMQAALDTIFAEDTQRTLLDRMQTRQQLYDLINYEDFDTRDRQFFDGESTDV